MYIVLDKIVGEKRVECMVNTDHIVSVSPILDRQDRYGNTVITLSSIEDSENDVIYTDCKVAHIKEAMCGLVVMNEIKNYEPVVEVDSDE